MSAKPTWEHLYATGYDCKPTKETHRASQYVQKTKWLWHYEKDLQLLIGEQQAEQKEKHHLHCIKDHFHWLLVGFNYPLDYWILTQTIEMIFGMTWIGWDLHQASFRCIGMYQYSRQSVDTTHGQINWGWLSLSFQLETCIFHNEIN